MKQFNHILKSLDQSDVYSKLMLGQIHTLMSAEKSKASASPPLLIPCIPLLTCVVTLRCAVLCCREPNASAR
jgi:hypothetical protein